MSERNFYRVVTDEEPCKSCHAGQTWTVEWIENGEPITIGESFGDEDEAQSRCDDMNLAFDVGRTAHDQLRREIIQEQDEHLRLCVWCSEATKRLERERDALREALGHIREITRSGYLTERDLQTIFSIADAALADPVARKQGEQERT